MSDIDLVKQVSGYAKAADKNGFDVLTVPLRDLFPLIERLEAAERELKSAESRLHEVSVACATAELERDEMRHSDYLMWHSMACKNGERAQKAEAELARRDAAAGVSFYRDGVIAAANYIDQQREAFDNEHGQRDPDTGSFEFGNLAAQEHSDTLAELAEGVRTLHDAVPPAVLPPEKHVPPFLTHQAGKAIGWNDCIAEALKLGAQQQKPVVLPADRADDKSVSTFDSEKFYDAGWNSRGKADKEALDAANVPYEVKK